MFEQRTIPSTSDYDTRAGSTRRQALMTMVTGGVLGMLAVGPAAAQCGGPDYHGRVSLAERRRYAELSYPLIFSRAKMQLEVGASLRRFSSDES